ncbi:Methylenetetrahydrofolate reductase [Natronincola peptidivorans]|uniref:Methylenetetrahydrofolate reductase n=1 Tax=Natronincola peptidivorans TaxID=426128 RepID=A0A1I0CDN9_9FIRM|nr:methylenetetrahydrofolate reductase [Natronincola peptidivorans]SET17702.1 Methylenetetrahydrofolate reductase [Natronincola peptidivorans]
MLKEKILRRESGIITYGLTPPKQRNTLEKIQEISQKQIERIQNLEIDGLVIYDIQEEADRIKDERPFPFLPTLDPGLYSNKYLEELNIPKIIYRCVSKYTQEELSEWMKVDTAQDKFSVFVGAASRKQKVNLSLQQAYHLRNEVNPDLLLGAVTIPERHIIKHDEHMRVIKKMENGCKYFISQAVYNVEASKNFLSDYYYYCMKNQIEMVPIIFTITPCGSIKTLEFMRWLGISIPRWLENDLKSTENILEKSVDLSKEMYKELLDFALEKGIPFGCNIESLSVRKVEIEASIELVEAVQQINKRMLYQQVQA